MTQQDLLILDRIEIAVWVTLTVFGLLYLLSVRRKTKRLRNEIPELSVWRLKIAITAGLVVTGCSLYSIFCTYLFPVELSDTYLLRVSTGRPAWIVAIASQIVLQMLLEASTRAQAEEIKRQDRTHEREKRHERIHNALEFESGREKEEPSGGSEADAAGAGRSEESGPPRPG